MGSGDCCLLKYAPKCIRILLFCICGLGVIHETFAQSEIVSATDLKKLDVEELMNVEVSLVTRSPQRLSEASSSVQVITGEEIRRSGATNLAEALRLVSNLQVAQSRSNTWLIGSRGFNTLFANKLLVMIDGRTVYTPLFAGVFWEMQHVLLEDIDKIEVVSGPGGALWGANAVNGIINVITKNTRETTGLYASGTLGTLLRNQAEIRYGGKIDERTSFKVYGLHFNRDNFKRPDGTDADDAWHSSQGGFQVDWTDDRNDRLMVKGDVYGGEINTNGTYSDFNGQNLLAKWQRTISAKSGLTLQAYFDRYLKRDGPDKTMDQMVTADVDFQHSFTAGKKHSLVWGAGFRRVRDHFFSNTSRAVVLPPRKNLDLLAAFVNDEIKLASNLTLTLGAKALNNVYTGFEFQPSARVGLTLDPKNNLWAAVSRAVRTPSRVDIDYFAPAVEPPPGNLYIRGGDNFVSEKVIAYELGYRVKPDTRSAFSLATFYNHYNDLYSLDALPGTLTYVTGNGTSGKAWGAEISGSYQVSDSWRLKGGYTYFDKKLTSESATSLNPAYQGNDVRNQVMVHSMSDLPFNLELDIVGRYLDFIPVTLATALVPSYVTFDMRIAYHVGFVQLSVVGQNLLEKNHKEFGSLNVPRSVYAKIALRL